MKVIEADKVEIANLETQVCIIGSGAGGAMAAAKLASQGIEVLVIEEGPNAQKEHFTQDEQTLVKEYYRLGGALATDDMSYRILQGRVLGGSTTINWMNCFRTPDDVLEEWATDFGLEEYLPEHLSTHFDALERRMNIHTVPDTDHSPQNQIILKGAQALGIHAAACRNNSKDCIGCGKCGLGCYYDAKMDMRLTYLSDADNAGARVITRLRADKIEYESENAQRIRASITTGKNQGKGIIINTKKTILAASTIYSPLLIQASNLNKNGFSGKYLHLHPVAATAGIYEKEIFPTYGIPMSAYSHEYKDIHNGYGFWQEVPDLEVFLAGVNTPGHGALRRSLLQQINNLGAIISLVRDGASKQSNGQVKWKRGFNSQNGRITFKKVPSIRYKIDPLDMQHLLLAVENAIEIHLAAGASEVIPYHSSMSRIRNKSDLQEFLQLPMGANYLSTFSAHPTGTNRMGKDEKRSVVNQELQIHGKPGVYVMDASVLPTAPGVNPMETILGVVARAIELGNAGF